MAATAPIRPLAWELPCALGVALKRKKKLSSKTLFFQDSREKCSGSESPTANDGFSGLLSHLGLPLSLEAPLKFCFLHLLTLTL